MPYTFDEPTIADVVEGKIVSLGEGESQTSEFVAEHGTGIFKVLFDDGSSEYFEITEGDSSAEEVRQRGSAIEEGYKYDRLYVYLDENATEISDAFLTQES